MEYFFWCDFAGVNQFDHREKILGVSKLSAMVAACGEIIMYNSSSTDYEPRAWTRVERMLGFTYTVSPVFVYLDDGYPETAVDIDSIVASNTQAFVKHPQTGQLMLILRNPAGDGAQVRDDRDRQWIEGLADATLRATPLNPLRNVAALVFGETLIPLDTEHFSIDVNARERLQLQRQMSVTQKEADGPE